MTTISTVKKLAASAVIAGSLGLAGAVLTVAPPANAAPSSAAGTASSPEKRPGHANGSGGEESQRVGDATRASELRHDWDNQRGK